MSCYARPKRTTDYLKNNEVELLLWLNKRSNWLRLLFHNYFAIICYQTVFSLSLITIVMIMMALIVLNSLQAGRIATDCRMAESKIGD